MSYCAELGSTSAIYLLSLADEAREIADDSHEQVYFGGKVSLTKLSSSMQFPKQYSSNSISNYIAIYTGFVSCNSRIITRNNSTIKPDIN